jgi:NAD(P)-dependent dehydrogenase (short-subunit alcohol dehydrogenase family)
MNKYTINNLFGIYGKVFLITGASGQLGSQIVGALLVNGAKVVACDTSLNLLSNQYSEFTENSDLWLVECDIRDKNKISEVIDLSAKRFGTLDGLVCNAGISVFEDYLDRPESSIDLVMDVNLKGTIFCIQEFLKFKKLFGGGGSIVNIASHYGIVSPDPRIYTDCERKNSEIYGATKAGIIQMTKYYATHAAELNVRTNCVSPGGIRNPDNPQGADFQANYSYRCPMGRMAETEEIIGAIIFLLSSAASYTNGVNITVDGGTTAW